MKIAIDVDGVVDAIPKFLSLITNLFDKKKIEVIILTSRSNTPEVIRETLKEIEFHKIQYDSYFFLPNTETRDPEEFPNDLSWFDKHIWQKAEFCRDNQVDIMFEDDEKTINHILKYSPNTRILQVR